ncbi:hypothetical protein D3C75_1333070 [compost metagenome]
MAVTMAHSSSACGGRVPSSSASRTALAIPAWDAPQVALPCRSLPIAALFTYRVIGLTGMFGWAITMNGQ